MGSCERSGSEREQGDGETKGFQHLFRVLEQERGQCHPHELDWQERTLGIEQAGEGGVFPNDAPYPSTDTDTEVGARGALKGSPPGPPSPGSHPLCHPPSLPRPGSWRRSALPGTIRPLQRCPSARY